MSKLWAMRVGSTLHPADAESAAVLAKFTVGKLVMVEARQPRNGPHHRLFWVMCTRIANAIGAEPENVSDVLKVETGHCVTVKTKDTIYKFPRSISYASMDQSAFSSFFERCLGVIYSQWGITRPDILSQLEDVLTPKTEQRS